MIPFGIFVPCLLLAAFFGWLLGRADEAYHAEKPEPHGKIQELLFATDEFGKDCTFGQNRHGVWYRLTPNGWEQLPSIPDDGLAGEESK